MRKQYLGDALDFWKGALLGSFQDVSALRSVAVYPMLTDAPDEWQGHDFECYARLLKLESPDRILRREMRFRRPVRAYFTVEHGGDLFLDPDTGIETASGHRTAAHVGDSELRALLEQQPGRVVAVYQHADRTHLPTKVKQVLDRFSRGHGAAYVGAQVAMLFLSGEPSRIAALASTSAAWLPAGRWLPQ